MEYYYDAPTWLSGKRILMTGATGGIGRALVKQLVAWGPELLLVGRNIERLSSLPQTHTHSFLVDLNKNSDIDQLFVWIDEHWKGLDVLIHNATSPVTPTPVPKLSRREMLETIRTGPLAALELIKAASHRMGNDGRILLTSSMAGHSDFPRPQPIVDRNGPLRGSVERRLKTSGHGAFM